MVNNLNRIVTMKNKDHWYDGVFYDKVIAPNQDKLFRQVKDLIKPGSKVIDVGCGTGRFSFFAADICHSVAGIDLSRRNIERAQLNHSKEPFSNISFQRKDVASILLEGKDHFDYAVMTYVLHEVDAGERIQLIKDLARIADTIIVGDYLVPRKSGFWDFLNELVEFGAGSEHYRNFKSYVTNGGISVLANRAGCTIMSELTDEPSTSHIAVMVKRPASSDILIEQT